MLRSIMGSRDVKPPTEVVTVLPTIEIRWFGEDAVPTEVREWFGGLSTKMDSQPARVDHYLMEPRTDAVGIKFRQGRIEVKQLRGERRLALLAPGWEGYVEQWHKWGFTLALGQRRRRALMRLDSWLPVRKKRYVIEYGISSTGQPIALRGGSRAGCICSVELTEVRVRRDTCWTLGFEAELSDEASEHGLRRVAREVLDAYPLAPIEPSTSLSYPSWLRGLQATAGA